MNWWDHPRVVSFGVPIDSISIVYSAIVSAPTVFFLLTGGCVLLHIFLKSRKRLDFFFWMFRTPLHWRRFLQKTRKRMKNLFFYIKKNVFFSTPRKTNKIMYFKHISKIIRNFFLFVHPTHRILFRTFLWEGRFFFFVTKITFFQRFLFFLALHNRWLGRFYPPKQIPNNLRSRVPFSFFL